MAKKEYEIGSLVYLVTDPDQLQRMVTGYTERPGGFIIYYLSHGAEESTHYEIEIAKERDIIKATTN